MGLITYVQLRYNKNILLCELKVKNSRESYKISQYILILQERKGPKARDCDIFFQQTY